jgi:hypothetical protein
MNLKTVFYKSKYSAIFFSKHEFETINARKLGNKEHFWTFSISLLSLLVFRWMPSRCRSLPV